MKKLFLLFAFLLMANTAYSATFYVRPSGGTSSQCNGQTNVDYSAGVAPACAFNHPAWALGAFGTDGLMSGGDTLIIKNGSYMIGVGMPNTVGCSYGNPRNCILDIPPSGSASTPTRILGEEWNTGCSTKPELWGQASAKAVFDLTGASNIELQCLDLTDHDTCGYEQTNIPNECVKPNGSNTSSVGPYALYGIFSLGTTNLKMWNLDIHGFATFGAYTSDLHGNIDVSNVNIDGNYSGGWDGDTRTAGGSGSLQDGTLRAHKLNVRYNGCREEYPRSSSFSHSDYSHCTAQDNQGYGVYGDGMGSFDVAGTWIFTEPNISWNSSDGLDLLYGTNNTNVYIDKGTFLANNGNGLKISGKIVEVTNTALVGNCMYLRLANKLAFPSTFNSCRTNGLPIAITPVLGSAFKFRNVTSSSGMPPNGDGTAFLEISNYRQTCNGTETYDFKNLIGYNHSTTGSWTSGNGFYNSNLTGSCLTAFNNRTVTYSKLYNYGGTHAGTGNSSTAPAWVGTINQSIPSNISSIMLSSNVGGGDASTYWNTSTDVYNFPQNASIDQGALQYGTDSSYLLKQDGQACVADSDCANGDCSNFACSGSCTTTGGACASGATCCSGYCNGSSLCAVPTTCGDGNIQPGEVCDTSGPNLNGNNCIQEGFTAGNLGCSSDCLSFDTSSCNNLVVFPLSPILDNFNRANGGIGSNFNVYTGGLNVSSNAVVGTTASTTNLGIWSLGSFTANQEAYITVASGGTNSDKLSLYLRGNLATQNGYLVYVDPGASSILLMKLTGGATSTLATVSQTMGAGDSIGASFVGNTFTLYYIDISVSSDWVPLTSVTDSTYTDGGTIGFSIIGGTGTPDMTVDNFGGGSIVPVVCGNGVKEGTEICDGSDLGGQNCNDRGFASGNLACLTNCTGYDTSGCATASTCGNDTIESGESCDGSALNSLDCTDFSFASGTLSCNSNCLSFNTSACISGGSGITGGVIIK